MATNNLAYDKGIVSADEYLLNRVLMLEEENERLKADLTFTKECLDDSYYNADVIVDELEYVLKAFFEQVAPNSDGSLSIRAKNIYEKYDKEAYCEILQLLKDFELYSEGEQEDE